MKLKTTAQQSRLLQQTIAANVAGILEA